MESWNRERLGSVATVQTGLMKGKELSGEIVSMPYLRVANVQDGYLNLSEIKNIQVEKSQIARYLLRENDVLFTEGGDYDKLGRGAVWQGEIENCLHQNHVFAVRPETGKLDSHYLSYLSGSSYGKAYFLSCSKQTTNLASINSTQLKDFPVLRPSLPEQHEIVRILNSLFEQEQKAKDLYDIPDKIDLLKKAILIRAFRGELGTNDPEEGSAVEMLRELIIRD